MLAIEQKQAYDLTKMLFLRDERDVIMILGHPGSGKSTTIHSIIKMVEDILHGSVLRLGTIGTTAFVIAGATCHSALRLPINRQFRLLQGSLLCNLQASFPGKKVIITDEVSMMGRKMLVQIEQILRQASGREDLLYSGFIVIIVGYFQQIPPVGDKPMYTEGNAEASLLLNKIQHIVILKQPQ